jgi:5-methylcytosine-specific restriction endonuclease McrA
MPVDARHTRRWREHTVPRILRRDGGICHLCGQPGAETADHLVPVDHGGSDAHPNLAAAHRRCNRIRGTRPIDEACAAIEPRLVTTDSGWTW